jgi:hypothetical protein
LICVDAKPPRNRFDPYDTKREPSPQEKRRNRVNQSIEERGGDCQIVCIPACVVNDFSGGQPGMTLGLFGNNKIVVLANSRPTGCRSFITDRRELILDLSVGGEKNQVVLAPMEALV